MVKWKSLSTKLFYTYAAVILVILLSFGVGISYLIREHMYDVKQKELKRHAGEIAHAIAVVSDEGALDNDSTMEYLAGVDKLLNIRAWVIDKDRKLVYLSPRTIAYSDKKPAEDGTIKEFKARSMADRKKFVAGQLQNPDSEFNKMIAPVYDGQIVTREFMHPVYNEQVLFVCYPIQSQGKVMGIVLISSAVSGMQDFLDDVHLYIVLTLLGAILLSLILVRWFSRETIAPLRRMQQSAAAMAAGDYSQYIEIKGEDEVAALGQSLNMLGRDLTRFVAEMTTQEKIRRDFVANVSHELRTPLTIIRGYNEAIADGTVQDKERIAAYQSIIRDEVSRLERLINDLLDISRLQAGKDLLNENIPMRDLIGDVLEKLKLKAQDKNIKLHSVLEAASIWGNGDRLVQLVIILVDNAIKYTPDNGRIDILLQRQAEQLCLTVADTGNGIPEEDLPYIWERFYKVDKSHSRIVGGTGLGLAIAKEIMVLHKATVQVTSKSGCGTQIKVCFPLRLK